MKRVNDIAQYYLSMLMAVSVATEHMADTF